MDGLDATVHVVGSSVSKHHHFGDILHMCVYIYIYIKPLYDQQYVSRDKDRCTPHVCVPMVCVVFSKDCWG